MTRFSRTRPAMVALATLLMAVALTGCTRPSAPTGLEPEPVPSQPPAGVPGGAAGGPGASSKLAPGLYEQPDGTVQVIGTLEYRDLEGGLWAITDGTLPEGDPKAVLAVIANADALRADLAGLKGLAVIAQGTRYEGVSSRMAGPEVTVTSIQAADDTPDPAQ